MDQSYLFPMCGLNCLYFVVYVAIDNNKLCIKISVDLFPFYAISTTEPTTVSNIGYLYFLFKIQQQLNIIRQCLW